MANKVVETALDVLDILVRINHEIRVPTACWLISDVLGVLDVEGREALYDLKDRGIITIDVGGWIKLGNTPLPPVRQRRFK